MATTQIKLYQRLNTTGYPIITVDYAKNGYPLKNPHATTYYLRYRLDGKRVCEPAGNELMEAENKRKGLELQILSGVTPTSLRTPAKGTRQTIADAVALYYANLAARGIDKKSIRTYRYAVDSFAESCSKTYVDQIEKQDLINYMGWLRNQPRPKRKHGNSERTFFNKVSHVAIFLKEFGKSGLLKKNEYPTYEEKMIRAHTDAELDVLYKSEDDDMKFFLDFMLGSMMRDGEAAHCEYSDLHANAIEIKKKPQYDWHPKKHHCRIIPISQALAATIRERQKKSESPLLFPNGGGRPNYHLLRDLQDHAEEVGATFHTELHKLRKTGATRIAKHLPIYRIQKLLGHKNIETTIRYLADVDLTGGEMESAVESAAYKPKQ